MSTSSRIIATATDRNFVELAGVMLHSLVATDVGEDVRLVVFCDGLRPGDKSNIARCVHPRTVEFIDLQGAHTARMATLQTNSNWSRAIYTRLLMPQLLGVTTGRIVYLDADTLVVDSVNPLFKIDLGIYAVGAMGGKSAKETARLGLAPDINTFNSGVLVVDVEKWLKEDISEKTLALAAERASKNLPAFDQDVLNIVLNGRFAVLDYRWNCLGKCEHPSPAVIHFTHAKPNTTRCVHPWRHVYFEHRAQTPWARSRLKTKWDRRARRLSSSLKRIFGRF
ncbi:glycosyltransferase family 8 protein [Rhizobium sp. LjRoot258]|jgi:lipopolysaccharide biosynthesis glycosyltransferase|uniref:glycosyltransferase family 8 protein n=1 Tax=Rhizobium sp. LjRoot258 TaxID=3342299 RepID=UPI003ECCE998